MAEPDQDPIALLERICRLESSMDASMIFEEDEPTVRMGQDGFALALTQAKLSRLEHNYNTLAERYLALRTRFVKLQQHCLVLKERLREQDLHSSAKRSPVPNSPSNDYDDNSERSGLASSARGERDGASSHRDKREDRDKKEKKEKEKRPKKDRSPRSTDSKAPIGKATGASTAAASSPSTSGSGLRSPTGAPPVASSTTSQTRPPTLTGSGRSLTASMTNVALANPPAALTEDAPIPSRKPSVVGGPAPAATTVASSPLALPKQPAAAVSRPARSNTPTALVPPAATASPPPVFNTPAPLPLPDSDPGAIKKGWLIKLRKSPAKRYWFVITAGGADGPEFSWRVSDRPSPRKGFVLLRSALISVPKAQVDPNIALKPNTLLVRPARGARTKPLFVCTNDRPELIQWLDQLLAAAHKE